MAKCEWETQALTKRQLSHVTNMLVVSKNRFGTSEQKGNGIRVVIVLVCQNLKGLENGLFWRIQILNTGIGGIGRRTLHSIPVLGCKEVGFDLV